ncbi:MAG: amidase [Dehalococcoidia bacterium]|nr:amidase [Dehalococcoidia bacterium]
MPEQDICWKDAVELAGDVRTRRVSPLEVVRHVLDRIERLNPVINAYVTVCAESALAEATKAEEAVMRKREIGPLHGIPVSFKDLIHTAGIRTTLGSRLFADLVPGEDAVLVARLKQAGAIVLGKTNTPEFGYKPLTENPLFGITRNPWNLDRTPGGSSGGAAAAVAAGLGPLAVGNDGGGSIRIPSSCCGVFGLKPHLGRIPRYPAFAGSEIITHEGPITRTVRDAALMLDIMAGPHWGDCFSLPATGTVFSEFVGRGVKGLRFAWSSDLGYAEVDPEVRRICESAALTFAGMGAVVEEASPGFLNNEKHIGTLFGVDGLTALSDLGELEQFADRLDPLTHVMLLVSAQVSVMDYVRAMFARREISVAMGRFLQTYDLLLTPTLALPPLPVGYPDAAGFLKWIPFTFPFNLTGQPAASVPAGWTADGLPVGLQIVGRAHDEATILRAASAFEEAQPWSGRKPPVTCTIQETC